MKKEEKFLLGIYLEIQAMNEGKVGLTGSLLLAFKDLPKARKAKDVDMVCSDPQSVVINSNFANAGEEQKGSDGYCRKLIHKATGTRIDILGSGEPIGKSVNYGLEVNTGSVELMMEAKESYSDNDLNEESRKKHCDDLDFLNGKLHLEEVNEEKIEKRARKGKRRRKPTTIEERGQSNIIRIRGIGYEIQSRRQVSNSK